MPIFPTHIAEREIRPKFSRKDCVSVQSSPLSSFLTETIYDHDVEEHCTVHYGTDVGIMLNQQRITRELAPIINDLFNAVHSPDLSDDFSNLSDDEILSCIKSRYCQSLNEVRDWTSYLMSELKELNAQKETEQQTEVKETGEQSETQTE